MLIMYFDLNPCCLLEVALWMIVEYNMRCLKVIEYPRKDSPLLNRGRVYLWSPVRIVTQKSQAIVEMP